jgi:O-antigen ligase
LGGWAALLAPGAILVFLSFQGGGFFPTAPAVVAVVLAVALILRVTLVARPFAGFNGLVGAIAIALALLAAWTLGSALWSDAPGRAILEFDRALLYLLTFALFASAPMARARLAWTIGAVLAGIVVVCGAGFVTRTLPELWPIAPNLLNQRLSYPVTYWNALGLLAAIGTILAVHVTASEREPRRAQVLAAAAVPLLTSTLLLTFSRGANAMGVLGVLAYLVLGRPRALLGAVLAIVPTAVLAVFVTYDADAISSRVPTGPTAVAEGQDVALVVGLCMLAALALRWLALRLDARVAHVRLPASARGRLPWLVALAAAGGVAAALALGAPAELERQYDRFLEGNTVKRDDPRERLALVGNNGRLRHWRVAVNAFRADPLTGSGAGTYQLEWARERQERFTVSDGHSLYVEALGELGLVGLALVLVIVLGVLGGLLVRARGPDRGLYAAAFAAIFAWAVHAGIDWDWEMPAVTLWVFALAGVALARPHAAARAPGRTTRVLVGLGCLVLAVTPAQVAWSQLRLDEAVRALRAGDCATVIDAALDSIAAVPARPQGYEVLAYCDVRQGEQRLAVQVMEKAIARDPESWELYYGLALVRGAARMDPRPAAKRALELNPLEPLAVDAVRHFNTRAPAKWEREALQSPLPLTP